MNHHCPVGYAAGTDANHLRLRITSAPEYHAAHEMKRGSDQLSAMPVYLQGDLMTNDKNLAPHKMGLPALTIMTASNMMGSGVFMLPATLAGIGSVSVWGWMLTFPGVIVLALIFNKINAIHPQNGGIIANIGHCFGPFVGLQMTLFYWLSTWIGNCALLLASISYLSGLIPGLSTPTGAFCGCMILLWLSVVFGLFGVRLVGVAQIITGSCMMLVILSVAIGGGFHFSTENYLAAYNVSGQSQTRAIFHAATLSMWGFLGMESASVSSGQVKDPRRTIPLATLAGLGIALLCYLVSSNAIMGLLPHSRLVVSASPFADSASLLWGHRAAQIVSLLVVIACIGAIPGWQILQTEVPRAAAAAGVFPAVFGKTNRFGVPWVALIFTSLLMSGVLLMTLSADLQSQFRTVIGLAVSASLYPYAFAALSLPVMLIRLSASRRKITGWVLMAIIALTFVSLAIISGQSDTLVCGILIQMATLPLYLLYTSRRKTPALQDESGQPAALLAEYKELP